MSPLHNLFIEGILVPAEALLNGSTITRSDEMDPIPYYSIELTVHAAVLAENLPAESYIDRGDRAMFTTVAAAEADGVARTEPGAVCAPILQSGPSLDRIRARIALRAGITPPDIMERPQDGPLHGKIEWVDHTQISGWAWLPEHPDVPVVLEILKHGETIAIVVANQFRGDLRRAGIGTGHHAFHVELPRTLDPRLSHELVVRRAADGTPLEGSPFTVRPIAPSSALTDIDLAAMIAEADLAETRRVLEWLERQAVKLHARLMVTEPTAADLEAPGRSKEGQEASRLPSASQQASCKLACS